MLHKTPGKPLRICAVVGGKTMAFGRLKNALAPAILIAIGFGAACVSAPLAAMADPSGGVDKQVSVDSQDTLDQSDKTNNGGDITRPQNALETRFFDETSSTDTSKTNRARMLAMATSKISFSPDWRLSLLAQAPILDKTTTHFDPYSVDHEYGLGDAAVQTIIAHSLNERWAVGVGARVIARTADDGLGSEKWQILPGFGVRYSLLEFGADSYFVPSMRWAISFAGDPTKRDISEAQIAPTLNIDLPGRWFFTFYPSYDIRINYGAPKTGQTGQLFLPFDALIGTKLADNLQISLEGSVPIIDAYPVYKFKTELRVRVLF